MNWLQRLNPQQKRIAAALGAGLLLGLVVILSRRGEAPSQSQDAGAAGAGINPLTDPTSGYTFADNGAAVGELTSQVSGLTGRMDLAFQALADRQLETTDALKELPGQINDGLATNNTNLAAHIGSLFAALQPPPAPAAPPAQVAVAGNPNASTAPRTQTGPQPTAAQAQAAAKPNIVFQDNGSRAGLNYKVVLKGGDKFRFYESKPGKGDWGEGGKIKV